VHASLQVLFKLTQTMGREGPGDSNPVISEWGEAWVILGPGVGGPGAESVVYHLKLGGERLCIITWPN
jgi:hypothetical protein